MTPPLTTHEDFIELAMRAVMRVMLETGLSWLINWRRRKGAVAAELAPLQLPAPKGTGATGALAQEEGGRDGRIGVGWARASSRRNASQ